MKKAVRISVTLLLSFALLCAFPVSFAEEPPLPSVGGSYSSPLDLFGSPLNPFSVIDFPEGYIPYKADVTLSADTGRFSLSLLTDDPGLFSFAASLINASDPAEASVLEQAFEEGTETGVYGDGLEFEIGIQPAGTDNHYDTNASGYSVTLSTRLDADQLAPYREVVQRNINANALLSVQAFQITEPLSQDCGITVVTGSVNYVNASFRYRLEDAYPQWSEYFQSDAYRSLDTVSYWGEENVSSFTYGDLNTRVSLLPEIEAVQFVQELEGTDINIADYVAPLSLLTAGFDKMCNYAGADGNIYLGIRKEIFGDTDEGEGNNYIKYLDNSGQYDCFLVIYYRPECKYYVQIAKGDQKAEYLYYALEDQYTDLEGGTDTSEQKEKLRAIINTDADSVLASPINTFEQYIINTFGINSDALYDLPKE